MSVAIKVETDQECGDTPEWGALSSKQTEETDGELQIGGTWGILRRIQQLGDLG